MIKSVLLIYPRINFEKNYVTNWIPYSVLAIASYLEDEYEVSIYDENQKGPFYLPFSSKYDLVCISSMTGSQLKRSIQLIKQIKTSDNIVVLGGAFATLYPNLAMGIEGLDYITVGQGEYATKLLIEYINGYKSSNELINTIDCRNKLQYPINIINSKFSHYNFKLINVNEYVRFDKFIAPRTVNYISSQGCSFGCYFCSDSAMYSKKWISEDVDETINNIKYLVSKYNISGVKFYDSNFFIDKDRVIRFSKSLIEENIHIKWAASTHPLSLLSYDDDEMNLLCRSGCSRLLIGLESPNQKVLDLVNKHITKEKLYTVIRKCNRFNIHCSYTLLVGFPEVPSTHIAETLSFAKEIIDIHQNSEVKVHILYPYNRTQMHTIFKNNGHIMCDSIESVSSIDYYTKNQFVTKQEEDEIRLFNERYSNSVISKKFILLCGKKGSGKSTFAKLIYNKFGFPIISASDIIDSYILSIGCSISMSSRLEFSDYLRGQSQSGSIYEFRNYPFSISIIDSIVSKCDYDFFSEQGETYTILLMSDNNIRINRILNRKRADDPKTESELKYVENRMKSLGVLQNIVDYTVVNNGELFDLEKALKIIMERYDVN